MADKFNIYQICDQCSGTGIMTKTIYDKDGHVIGSDTKPCYYCDETGEKLWGQMREEEPPE